MIKRTLKILKDTYVSVLAVILVIGFFVTIYISLSPAAVALRFDPLDVESPVLVDKETYKPGEMISGAFHLTRRTDAPSTIYRSIVCDTGFYERDPVTIPASPSRNNEETTVESAIFDLSDRYGNPIRPGTCQINFVSEISVEFGGRDYTYHENYQTVPFEVRQ